MPRDPRAGGLAWKLLLVLALLLPAVTRAAAKWYVVRGEFFDVYTNAGKTEAINTAVWMEQFRRTVGTLWKIEPQTIRRATIVQFQSERDFSPYRDARFKGGYFAHSPMWAAMAFGDDLNEEWVRTLVQHESVHWLLGSKRGRWPLWVNEGFAEIYSTVVVEGRECSVFLADEANLRWLKQHGVHSLGSVLARRPGDLDYNNEEMVRAFYAQSWGLLHYLLRGEGVKDGTKRLLRYLELTESGVSTDAAFPQAFGLEIAQMQQQLARHVASGRYLYSRIPFAREEIDRLFRVEPAPEVEVQCALAMLALAGRRDALDATVRFREARDRFPDSPLPYEGLGSVACTKGDYHLAVPLYNEALARGSRNPYVRYLPASFELRDQLGGDPRRYSLLPADARRLSDTLRTALEQNSMLDRAPDELGLALLFTDPIEVEDVKFLVSLARHTEEPGVVFYRTAGLLHRVGQIAEARNVLQKIAATSKNPLLKAATEADLAQLDDPAPRIRVGCRPVWMPNRPTLQVPLKLPGPGGRQ